MRKGVVRVEKNLENEETEKMMTDECVVEFKQSLEENLVSISKPAISMLTMLAEDNLEHAEHIAAVIIERAAKVCFI